ncbi:MAG: hydroxymethylbilane synthase [Bacteroidetes bacterium]|nr:hydroxymethylbilane synthase [Bacteroidota bacterium]
MKKITIGSRGSDLALWQAHFVQAELKKSGLDASIKIIKTQGDKIQDLSFDKLEGKGFFTKEIEEALLAKEIDIAVHSHKDLPTTLPKGLIIAAVSEREDPSELLLIRKEAVDEKQKYTLKKNAILGTSSARRKAQFLAFRPDISIKDLRGNVPTRLQKLRAAEYDAIMLAAAGVERLNLDVSEFVVQKLNPNEFIPAPAQGVLALQIRESDDELNAILQNLNANKVQERIAIERKILNLFDGGCQLPLGVYCETDKDANDELFFKVWTSLSTGWDKAPKSLYHESKTSEGLALKIVEKLKSIVPASVFITRDKRSSDYFDKALTDNGYSVFSKALIDIRFIPIKQVPQTDWIFFSSKNAVKNFFMQKPNLAAVKIGCVGKSTADELRKFGKRADFIGYSTDTKLTGKQFASTVGKKTVLFPQAKESMRSIQQAFTNSGQTTDLSVYETLKKNEELVPDFEIGVFTSPSNVAAFFEKNRLRSDQKIIAMGESTAAALKKNGVRKPVLTTSFDDLGLVRAVFGL